MWWLLLRWLWSILALQITQRRPRILLLLVSLELCLLVELLKELDFLGRILTNLLWLLILLHILRKALTLRLSLLSLSLYVLILLISKGH